MPSVVRHGSYSRQSCFDLVQHKYAAGGHPGHGGYVEALEIKDAPASLGRFVLYMQTEDALGVRGVFFEFDTLPTLLSAFTLHWMSTQWLTKERKSQVAGMRRAVWCGDKTPWFYATEQDRHLLGLFTDDFFE